MFQISRKKLRSFAKDFYYKNVNVIDFMFSFYQESNDILYFPTFSVKDKEELDIHIAKANWFYQSTDIQDYNIYVHSKELENVEKPSFMMDADNNVTIKKSSILKSIIFSKNILLWNSKSSTLKDLISIIAYIVSGKRLYYIQNNDIRAKEYNIYTVLPWIILSKKLKNDLILNMKLKLIQDIKYLKDKYKYKKSYVIANGPSLESIFDVDTTDGYTIVANSIVRNKNMMEYIKPKFIVAGDPLWHFGACEYAKNFRDDLIDILMKYPETYAVFPAESGIVNYLNLTKLRERIILIPYGMKKPTYNLEKEFFLPAFTSVINSLMLPLAATLSNDIYILGSDGNVKHRPSEDFWAHAGNVQYSKELVETGHKCSPTFDLLRKSFNEVKVVENYLTETIEVGEKKFNKRYFNLSKITTFDILKTREI